MKILYTGNWSPYAFSNEKLVKKALEKLGHEVVPIDEQDYDFESIVKHEPDLFLFHKGTRYGKSTAELIELLNKLPCKKAFWFFDPVHYMQQEREEFLRSIVPFVDRGFLTDGSWVSRNRFPNTRVLRQGCDGEDTTLGEYKEKYDYDVVFVGSIYGERTKFVEGLKYVYGDKFEVFNNVWGQDLKDLYASAKVVVCPRYPMNDLYWSNRIYMTLGNGGFLIHPRLHGLQQEYKEGVHYVAYNSGIEMKTQIDYYLKNEKERKKIQRQGYRKTIKNYTYEKRCQTLINEINKS